MTRELLILRHGKSSWDDPQLGDYERPLKKRGRRDATHIGHYLLDEHWIPDMVLSSTAMRAAMTTKRVCRAMDFPYGDVIWKKKLYFADTDYMIKLIQKATPALQRLMLVGHNPDLEDLTRFLCAQEPPTPPDGKLIPTATLVRLSIQAPWKKVAPGCATLLSITRPRTLLPAQPPTLEGKRVADDAQRGPFSR